MTKILLILLCGLSFAATAADIQVKVDRSHIELNETFTLVFESNETPDDDPDFSALEKDFQVLGTSTSSNMSIINGNYSRTKKWNVSLIALHKGTITIPSISFGSDHSPAVQINISEPQKSTGKQGEALISELDISANSAYPQQQIIVTQRLLSSSNINAYEFSPLKTSGVEISRETLGEVKQFQTKRGDTPYLVLEQRYAIYPLSAGQLTIEPSIASARVAIQGNRGNRSAFDPFRNNTKTLRRSSANKTITIKSVPNAFKGKHWLAAKEVQLVEEFPAAKTFSVGEPITRTLLLVADGQNSAQLPELITQEVNGLKQYPDKPLLKNNISETGITGIQQLKVAIIPSAKGQYTLPAMSIPWWNTQTNKLEHARIAARKITVEITADSTPGSAKPPQLNAQNNTPPETAKPEAAEPGNAEPGNAESELMANPTEQTSNTLWKIISFLLASALIVTLFLLWRNHRVHSDDQRPLNTEPHINSPSVKQAMKSLKLACDNTDAQAAKNALLDWGNALFVNQPSYSLGDLSSHVNAELAEKILLLNSSLYGGSQAEWKCNELYALCVKCSESINKEMNHSEKSTNAGKLEDLYK